MKEWSRVSISEKLFSTLKVKVEHMNIAEWEYKKIKLTGLSLAGVRTSITLPQYSVAFDVAQGLPHAIGMSTFLITHGHLDHAAGIPYIISQKAMNSHPPPTFLVPAGLEEPLREIMNQWSRIEGFQYDYKLLTTTPGQEIELKRNIFIKPFRTIHKINSQGYSICRRFRKLRADLTGKSREKIAILHKTGENVTENKTEILISFTGDTQIDFLDLSPEVKESKILLMETTYLDKRKSVSSAREWGHTHLDELIPRLPEIKSEKIVLIHTSSRYSFEEVNMIIDKKIPENERHRIEVFPGR